MDLVLTRALDVVGSICALVFLMPLVVTIALLVFLSDPGPVFFAHRRIGKERATIPLLQIPFDGHRR